LSTSITWVHCDEVSAFLDQDEWLWAAWELEVFGLLLLGLIDGFDLGSNDGEGSEGDSVELIEATPQSTLAQTLEDLSHILVLMLIRAVVDNDEDTESTTKILDGLCLTCSGRPGWGTSVQHTESL
jgi:hypothetical protein